MIARAVPSEPAQPEGGLNITCAATFRRLRVLAWAGDVLYASRGYELRRTRISETQTSIDDFRWETVATFRPAWWRQISAVSNLSSRLVRDGFHALAVLPSGQIVAAVPGAIVTLFPGETEFRVTHKITRGTRPLHITAIADGTIFWGEYFDNAGREEVHIYESTDGGATWHVAYTFPKGAIRHVHNVVYDPWINCLWIATGDYGNECRLLQASSDFRQVNTVMQGNQQARTVALVPDHDGLYFSSDTPLEKNHVYYLDHGGQLSNLAVLSSSSIYGCRVGRSIFFSTMVEPSSVNKDRHVRVYGSRDGRTWNPLLAWQKDRWLMKLFQYGNAFLPDGNNTTNVLALTTIAVESGDLLISMYAIRE